MLIKLLPKNTGDTIQLIAYFKSEASNPDTSKNIPVKATIFLMTNYL